MSSMSGLVPLKMTGLDESPWLAGNVVRGKLFALAAQPRSEVADIIPPLQ